MNPRKTIWIRLDRRTEEEVRELQRRQGRPSRSNMIEFAVKSYCDWTLRGIRPKPDAK